MNLYHIYQHLIYLHYIVILIQKQSNGWALELIPEEYRTHKVCIAAIKNNYVAIDFIPRGKMCTEFLLECINSKFEREKIVKLYNIKNDTRGLGLYASKTIHELRKEVTHMRQKEVFSKIINFIKQDLK